MASNESSDGEDTKQFRTVSFDTVTYMPAAWNHPAMLIIEPDGPGGNSTGVAFEGSEFIEFVRWLQQIESSDQKDFFDRPPPDAAELAERAEWDVTLMDGIEPESFDQEDTA